jgi:hypothetical protein
MNSSSTLGTGGSTAGGRTGTSSTLGTGGSSAGMERSGSSSQDMDRGEMRGRGHHKHHGHHANR